jgi:hypothetical protein
VLRIGLSACALLFACGLQAQEQPAQVVARCAGSASERPDGLTALARDCPGLEAALDALGIKAALADGVADRLNAGSLRDLPAVTRDVLGEGPDPAALAPLLRELQTQAPPQSWWQRWKAVLSRWLTGGGERPMPPWVTSWLERLTPGRLALELIAYVMIGAIVLLAAFIVWREVRAADIGGAGVRRRRGGCVDAASAPPAGELDELGGVAPHERPRVLFRLVAARLARSGQLPADRSLTHRELRARAQRVSDDERRAWQALARLAERRLYAAPVANDPDAAAVLADAQRLLLPAPAGPR